MQAAATDAPSGDTASCDKFALHSTGSGFGTAPNNYAGFGASFSPHAAAVHLAGEEQVRPQQLHRHQVQHQVGHRHRRRHALLRDADLGQPAVDARAAPRRRPTIDLYNSRGQLLATTWILGTASDAVSSRHLADGHRSLRHADPTLRSLGRQRHASARRRRRAFRKCQAPVVQPGRRPRDPVLASTRTRASRSRAQLDARDVRHLGR